MFHDLNTMQITSHCTFHRECICKKLVRILKQMSIVVFVITALLALTQCLLSNPFLISSTSCFSLGLSLFLDLWQCLLSLLVN